MSERVPNKMNMLSQVILENEDQFESFLKIYLLRQIIGSTKMDYYLYNFMDSRLEEVNPTLFESFLQEFIRMFYDEYFEIRKLIFQDSPDMIARTLNNASIDRKHDLLDAICSYLNSSGRKPFSSLNLPNDLSKKYKQTIGIAKDFVKKLLIREYSKIEGGLEDEELKRIIRKVKTDLLSILNING